jgi:hypothetical protein
MPMRTLTRSTALLVTALILGCGSLVDLEEYDTIPVLGELDLGAVSPAVSYDYWELRRAFGGPPDPETPDRVIGASGSRSELDPEVVAVLDTLHVSSGVGNRCLPAFCFFYVASVRESTIETWTSIGGWIVFFGSIDRPEEAALLAAAHDYYWTGRKETGAIKADDDGYELVVLKLVGFCDPVQVDRFVLHVSGSGVVTVKDSETWSKEDGVCI